MQWKMQLGAHLQPYLAILQRAYPRVLPAGIARERYVAAQLPYPHTPLGLSGQPVRNPPLL